MYVYDPNAQNIVNAAEMRTLESISTFIVFASPHLGDHLCHFFFGRGICHTLHLRLEHLHCKDGGIDDANAAVLHDERNAVAAIHAENGIPDFRKMSTLYQNIFSEANMKILKRVLAVAVLVPAALIISYLIYTGGQLNA